MSTSRRGKNEGSITLRSDGRWMARVDIGRGEDGRRRRKTLYGVTRSDCATKLNAHLGKAASGELLATSTPTVKSWLKHWYATHLDDWRPGTRRVYLCAIDRWLVPAFGPVRLEKLKAVTIQKWVNEGSKNGARAKIVTAMFVLGAGLKYAQAQDLLSRNVASLVRVPHPTRKKITPYSPEQAQKLIDAALAHPLGAAAIIAITLGLRMGEVGGLSWPNLDLERAEVHVRQQTQAIGRKWTNGQTIVIAPVKTENSNRTLTLPSLAVAAVKAHRVVQLQARMRAGSDWNNEHDLLFTTATGRPINPTMIRRALADILKAAGLPPLRFHGLRHANATMLLVDGAALFNVSKVLGHSDITTTANIYGHLVPAIAAGAAARMDDLLKKA